MTILIVEDEFNLSEILAFIVRRAGHDVLLACDGESALQLWQENQPELILLDVGLPKMTGWEVCRRIRSQSKTPVIMVSGLEAEADMVRGFDLGVEDYIVKPFSPRLLMARVNAVLKHSASDKGENDTGAWLRTRHFAINSDCRSLASGEQSVPLTRIQHQLFWELAQNGGQVVSHETLVQKVWGYAGEENSTVIKGHIHALRRKMSRIGCRASIRIVTGIGYMLEQ